MSFRQPLQCTIGSDGGDFELAFAMGDHATILVGLDLDDLREISSAIECILDVQESAESHRD